MSIARSTSVDNILHSVSHPADLHSNSTWNNYMIEVYVYLSIFLQTRPPLWSRVNIVASHLAGPGSIPDRVSSGWGSFWGFSSSEKQMSGKLRPHPSPDIIGHHNLQKSFHTGANDLRCRPALKPKYTYCTFLQTKVILNLVINLRLTVTVVEILQFTWLRPGCMKRLNWGSELKMTASSAELWYCVV